MFFFVFVFCCFVLNFLKFVFVLCLFVFLILCYTLHVLHAGVWHRHRSISSQRVSFNYFPLMKPNSTLSVSQNIYVSVTVRKSLKNKHFCHLAVKNKLTSNLILQKSQNQGFLIWTKLLVGTEQKLCDPCHLQCQLDLAMQLFEEKNHDENSIKL